MVKAPTLGFRYRWIILGVCWLGYIVACMQRLSIGPLAPFLKEDLALTSAQVGSLMSAAIGWGGLHLTLVGEIAFNRIDTCELPLMPVK